MSYIEGNVDVQTYEVASATEISKLRFVVVGANGAVVSPAAGAACTGVSQDASATGETASLAVAVLNGAKLRVEAGGTFAAGDNIATNASGQAVEATSGDSVLGKAVSAAVSGDIVTISTAI